MDTVGQRIASERLRKRWTQEHLAAETGITQSLLSDIENGKVSPKWDIIETVANILQVPVAALLPQSVTNIFNGDFNDNATGNAVNHYHSNEDEHKLWESLLKAKDDTIESLKLLVENLQKPKL